MMTPQPTVIPTPQGERATGDGFPVPLRLLLVIAAGVVLVSGVWLYRTQEQHLRQSAEDELQAIADLKVRQIAEWRSDQLGEGNELSASAFFISGVAKWMTRPQPNAAEEILARFRSLKEHYKYTDVVLVDSKGEARLSLSGRIEKLHPEAIDALTVARRDGKPTLSELHPGSSRELHLAVVAPLFSKQGPDTEFIGAVLLQSAAEHFLFPLIQSWPAPRRTAESSLVRRDGDSVLFLNQLRHQPNTPLGLRIPLSETNVPEAMAVQGREGVANGRDYRGQEVTAVLRRIPDSPWFLVAKVDTSETLALWRYRSRLIVVLLLALVVSVAIVVVLVWQRNQKAHFRALYQAEARAGAHLRQIYEESPLAYQSLAPDGTILEVNPAWERLLKYSRIEIIGRHFRDLLPPQSQAPLMELLLRLQERGAVNGVELQVRNREDSLLTVTFDCVCARDAGGQPREVHCMLHNVTERKRTETELRLANRALRMTSHFNQEIVRATSEADLLQAACQLAVETGGYCCGWVVLAEQDRGKSTRLAAHFELDGGNSDAVKVAKAAAESGWYPADEAIRTRRPAVAHNIPAAPSCHPPHDDTRQRHHTSVALPLNGEGQCFGAFGVHSAEPDAFDAEEVRLLGELAGDLAYGICSLRRGAEHKAAEEGLRRQAALLDAANEAIHVRLLDHTVTYWNAGAERLYGWTRTEAIGRKITELGDADAAAFLAAHGALLLNGSWSGELKKTSKTGKSFVVFCRWTLLRDDQGEPKEVLAINTDITEQKRLEAQFLRAQRMESIGALAGGVAHDLNNIMAPILLAAPLLREMVSDKEGAGLIETVESSARRGASIIKQLLIFARGKPAARVLLPLKHILTEMDRLVQETFPRNIRSCVRVSDDLWEVLGDATQIHQVLMNLCVNARDAMSQGGTLTLGAANIAFDENADSTMPEAKSGNYVCVSVTDTGTGIPPEHVDSIFDPFFTTKELGRGTGLGLATVLGIVRGHGGFVRVQSRLHQGTLMEVFLPACRDIPAPAAVGCSTPEPCGQGELILVVDDETAVRGSVQQALERFCYQVLLAKEGAEALTLFEQHRSEVKAVLTDLMMPGMDGSALVQALRRMEPRLPILGMTGLSEDTNVNELQGLGVTRLLNKPFVIGQLLATLHDVLRQVPDGSAESAQTTQNGSP